MDRNSRHGLEYPRPCLLLLYHRPPTMHPLFRAWRDFPGTKTARIGLVRSA
jgi:hypothetical protein